ncbi:uncharacterized protein F5891DRAFT_1179676 [Suillus fuscotomentosus]|uniref:Uncharacterized protein n=1 Tax=Suillus fuscotomentosus TaxID=1912939 RepID=A0AAD4HTL1_9AGAM|nr:uncharacterized protein F5891DRAFT_1179676 [Suillus fuscotomentosus]KAG1908157.1 hypothetical protein F5891DRAFT_1179676 [Suillus fuscotomentosus]
MVHRPENIPVDVWNAWPDHLKQAVCANTGNNQPNRPDPNIDPALTSGLAPAPRCAHDMYRDGPTSPHPYQRGNTNNPVASATTSTRPRESRRSDWGGTRASHRYQSIGLPVIITTTHPHLQVEKGQHPGINGAWDVPLRLSHVIQHQLPLMMVQSMKWEIIIPLHMVVQLCQGGHLITMKFHHVCNVSEGKSWPASADEECINAMTGEHYLMPEFTKTVNDDHNRMIFAKVASLVWEDLQNMANSDYLVNRKVKWNKQSLFTFAKETYHGFKEDWRAQNDVEKKAAKGKADRLMTACQAYIEKFNVDLVDLVHADHMSDEVSGPDDDELEDDWKRRMAEKMGMPANSQVENLSFLEVTRSPWRSDELGQIFHTLHDLWRVSLTSKQKKPFHMIRVTGTDYQSQHIPDFTLYTFGINIEWLEANKDTLEYQDLLKE